MPTPLDLSQIVAFAKILETQISVPGQRGNCSCNPTCGCESKEGSCKCENKCGCDSHEVDGESRRRLDLLANPEFEAEVAAFDAHRIKTIEDFLSLTEAIRDRLKPPKKTPKNKPAPVKRS